MRAFLCLLICILCCNIARAITIQEAITLAIQNSTEVEIEERKSELAGYSKADATTIFLPNASYGMRKGHRDTSISKFSDGLKEDVQTLTVSQPLFTGFQGVSRVKEAIHKTAAAKENLNFRKNEIALMTAESYLNILKIRKITELEVQQIADYKKLLELAKKKLELGDLEYSELSKLETQNQNTILKFEENKAKLRQYELSFELLTKQKPDGLSRPFVHSELKNLDDTLILAQKQNPKVKSAQHALKAAKTAVIAESGKVLPKVSLSFQHEHQQSSYYFNGEPITNKVIYLDITIPIFQSGSEYAGIAKANKQKQIANLEHKLAIEELEKKVREEYTKFTSLKASLTTFGEVLKGAIQSLKLAESRFNKKDLSQMDYLLKKIEISEVEKQAIATECDMLTSWFVLRSLEGEVITNTL
jgi:outer membrane protein